MTLTQKIKTDMNACSYVRTFALQRYMFICSYLCFTKVHVHIVSAQKTCSQGELCINRIFASTKRHAEQSACHSELVSEAFTNVNTKAH